MYDTTQTCELVTDGGRDVKEEERTKDIFERLTQPEDYTESGFTVAGEGPEGREELEFDISPIEDREQRWEYLSKLPGVSSGDPDNLDESAIKPDGTAITAIEDMVIEALSHPHLAPSEIEILVQDGFTDEVLFEAFGEVVERSTDLGRVSEFRK